MPYRSDFIQLMFPQSRQKRMREDYGPCVRRSERPRSSISDFDVQLHAFHDSLMCRVFSPAADDGDSEDICQSDILKLTHSMRLMQWKIQCCLDCNFTRVLPFNDDEWRFVYKLELNEHELRFAMDDEHPNCEWIRLTLPWIALGPSPKSYEPSELCVIYNFCPFFRQNMPDDAWVIRWQRPIDHTASIGVPRVHSGVLSTKLLRSRYGVVTVCDETEWNCLFREALGINPEFSTLSISFILRFLGRLCSSNGRNPAEDINYHYEKKSSLLASSITTVVDEPHAFYSNTGHEFYFPFLTEWWRERRERLILEMRDLVYYGEVRQLIPDLIYMIVDHACELAPLSNTNYYNIQDVTSTSTERPWTWQPQ